MHYKSHGSGDHLVVGLHGWTGDHRHFAALASHLPSDVRLVAFDLPGFGKSPPPSSWDMQTVGKLLAPEIDALEGETLTIVSNCSGAYPALKAVPHLSRKPARMVLVDAFAYAPKYFKVFTNRKWGHHAYRTTFANPIGRGITNATLRRQKRKGGITDDFKTANHEHTLAWLRACVDLGDIRQFASVQLPTLIAYGQGSFSAVRKSLPMWRELWPHAETLELTGAGHLSIVEAAEQLAPAVFELTGATHAA